MSRGFSTRYFDEVCMNKGFKYTSTERLLRLIEPYLKTFEFDDSCPSDKLDIGGMLSVSVEEGEPDEISWVDVTFGDLDSISFESNDEDYVEKAAELIIDLLTNSVEITCVYRRDKLTEEKLALIKNGAANLVTLTTFRLPFLPGKNSDEKTVFRYNKISGIFEKESKGENHD